MAKLFVNGRELTGIQDIYFEVKKGSVISSEPGTVNREYSTNITMPANENNVTIFRAHKLLGGNAEILKGVVYIGNEAFECVVQLVDFSEKEITVYIVRSSDKLNDFLKSPISEIIKDADKVSWIFPHQSKVFISYGAENRPNNFDEGGVEYAINNHSPYTMQRYYTSISLQSKIAASKFAGLVNLSGINSNFYPVPTGEGEMLAVMTVDNKSVTLGAGEGGGKYFLTSGNQLFNWRQNPMPYPVTCFLVIKTAEATGPLRLQIDEGEYIGYDPVFLYDGNIMLGEVFTFNFSLKPGNTPSFYWFSEFSGISFFIDYAVCIFKFDSKYLTHIPTWGYAESYKAIPEVTTQKVLADLAFEEGKYLVIDRSNKLVLKDLPSLDSLSVTSLEKYYITSKKVTLQSSSPLKAYNNYIQYKPDPSGNFGRVNIKIDDNRLYAPLDNEKVFKELCFRRSNNPSNLQGRELVFTGTDKLGASLEKFRIYRDTFNNVVSYEIDFRNLNEVPEGVLYIPQLNGLFIASEIIRTTRQKITVKCFKIEKQ